MRHTLAVLGRLALVAWLLGGGAALAASEPPQMEEPGALGTPALARPLPAPLRWDGDLFDDVLWRLAEVDRDGNYLADSYDGDATVSDGDYREESLHWTVRGIAGKHDRLLTEASGIIVFRHDRCLEAQFALARSRSAEDRARSLRVSRVEGKDAVSVDVRARRAFMVDLARELSRTTGERFLIKAPFERRQVTAVLRAVTAEQIRASVLLLFPDAEWVEEDDWWILRERADADLIRAGAEAVFSSRSVRDQFTRVDAALAASVMGDLDAAGLATLSNDGELLVPWSALSSATRSLFVQFTGLTLESHLRSNVPPEYAMDLSQTGALGIRIRRGPGRAWKFQRIARTVRGQQTGY